MSTLKLPHGLSGLPPLSFTLRESQFIALRYGGEKGLKEIAEIMRISVRTAKEYGYIISKKLGYADRGNGRTAFAIGATKKLIALGLIEVLDEKSTSSHVPPSVARCNVGAH